MLSLVIEVLLWTALRAEFVDQPLFGSILSPIGTELQLNCTVREKFSVSWTVTSPHLAQPVSSSDPLAQGLLERNGIGAENLSPQTTQLIFTGAVPVQVTVTCISIAPNFTRTIGNDIAITIYGPPPSPTNLITTPLQPGSLNIFWSFDFVNVTIDYMLTAVNLITSATSTFSTQKQHLTFSVKGNISCDTYSFQVTAIADSGSSPPSDVITRSIPSLPDIFLISANYSLTKSNSQFTLTIHLQDLNACPDYPVVSYAVVLVDDDGTLQRLEIESSTIIVIDELEEDMRYFYHIQAENTLGNSSISAGTEILTSDVWSVIICQIEHSRNYLIQCSYVEGSDARGCAYNISADGVESVTGTIARNNTEGVIVELRDADIYNVTANDLENYNAFGPRYIRINRSFAMCRATSTGTTMNPAVAATIAVVISARDERTTSQISSSALVTLSSVCAIATTLSLTTGTLILL